MQINSKVLFSALIVLLHHGFNTSGQGYKLKPERYKLKIIVPMDVETTKYDGSVLIKIYCEESTKFIVVNQTGLKIDSNSIWVRPYAESDVKNEGLSIVPREPLDNNEYKIEMEQELESKKYYEVKLKFSRKFPKNIASKSGFLLIDDFFAFTRIDGPKAASIFPCLDEVDMKAKFTIILKHHNTVKGLSNTEVDTTIHPKNQPDWTVEKFKETDSLASFSIGFVLMAYTTPYRESLVSSPEVKIRVRTYKDIKSVSGGVHEIVCQVLEFFTKIFSLSYSLGKLDVVVAPDMSLDVKGNFGLIFMSSSEASQIFNKGEHMNPDHLRYEGFSKLCRAISQQWIGNIVTMSNWYETWLSDGFNHFFQVKCVDEFHPELKYRFSDLVMINSFIDLLEMGRMGRYSDISIIRTSSSRSTSDKFNEITKTKINVLIRMMDFFLGPDTFNKSINNYLKHFEFSNVKVDDVWNKFTETTHEVDTETDKAKTDEVKTGESKTKSNIHVLPDSFTVKQIMHSWMTQKEIPLLTVTKIHGHNIVTVEQETFPVRYKEIAEEHEKSIKNPETQCWCIPLSFTTKLAKKFKDAPIREWLMCESGRLHVQIPRLEENTSNWFILDLEMKVLARINYDVDNWMLIRDTLLRDTDYSGLDVVARTQLISDLFALAEIGRVAYPIVFDTMKYLSREKEYVIWKIASKEFQKIWMLLLRTDLLEPFEEYVRNVLNPIFQENENYLMVDFSNQDQEMYQLKLLVMELSCKFSMEACKRSSQEILKIWKENPEREFSEAIPLRINELVHCEGVKHGNRHYRKRLRNRYRNRYPEPSEHVSRILSTALACAKRTGTLERYLRRGIKHNYTSYYNSFKTFKSLTSNKKGYRIMKKFLKNNLRNIIKFYNNDPFDKVWYFETLLKVTNKEEDMKELMKFAKNSRKIDMSLPRLYSAEEDAKYNIRWLKGNEEELRRYFKVPIPKQKKSLLFNRNT